MMISSGLCGRAGTCLFFFPTMFIRQTGYQVSQCVYGKAGRGVSDWWRLAVVLYILFFPSLPFPLSLISLVSFPCAAHLYPPALRGGRLLGFDIFLFSHLALRVLPRIIFYFNLSIMHPPSIIIIIITINDFILSPSTLSSSYLSAKISWSDVETDEEMNKTKLGVGCAQVGGREKEEDWWGFILEHRLDGAGGI